MEDKWVLKILFCHFSVRKEILSRVEIEDAVAPHLKKEAREQLRVESAGEERQATRCFVHLFETRPCYMPRLASNLDSSCLYLPCAGTTNA